MTITISSLISNPELPSIPESVIQLNNLIRDQAPMYKIAEIIETDPGLTLRTLELANSAWFKRQNSIVNVKDAVTLIGPVNLFQIIFSTSVVRAFSGINTDLMNMQEFWEQSVYMAAASKAISEQSRIDPVTGTDHVTDRKATSSDEYFTAGLLANIGKLTLFVTCPKQSADILDTANSENISQHLAEEKILGFNHAAIAAALLDKWRIDERISVPVQFHITPDLCPKIFQYSTNILYVANYLSTILRMFSSPSDTLDVLPKDYMRRLKLKEDDIAQISAATQSYFQQARVLLKHA